MLNLPKLSLPQIKWFNKSLENEYNKVYDTLVKDEKDLIGQIAYCLYKQSKQQFIKEYNKQNDQSVDNTTLDSHIHYAELPKLPYYQDKAETIVTQLFDQVILEKEKEMTKDFEKQLLSLLKNHDKRSWFRRHFSGGFSGLVGNTLTAIVVAGTLFYFSSDETQTNTTSSAKANIVSGVAKIVGVEIEIK